MVYTRNWKLISNILYKLWTILVLFLLDRFLRRAFLCVASALHSARRAIAIPLGLNPTKSSDQLDHDSDVIQ